MSVPILEKTPSDVTFVRKGTSKIIVIEPPLQFYLSRTWYSYFRPTVICKFLCEECIKFFINTNDLRIHKESVHQHLFDECNSKVPQIRDLNKHIESVHKE